jgi:hypothetical protein
LKATSKTSNRLYRKLKFPTEVYDHIGHYQEEKLQAGE